MSIATRIHRGQWVDSARLMQAARAAREVDGVEDAACFMGTPANLDEARSLGLWNGSQDEAAPDDVVIVARGDDAERGVAAADAALAASDAPAAAGPAMRAPRSLRSVDADLAIVSVPGEYAAIDGHKALAAGMDVLLFSDGVSIEDELRLKRRAHELGLLVMGPGAGTAIVDGVALGFANVVAPGTVGVAAAAGTGAQEVTVLVGRHGAGVSTCFGTGGRDLSEEIGAITMLDSIERLARDDGTDVVLVVSKPPADDVAEQVLGALEAAGKPAVACFVGARPPARPGVHVADTLAHAAQIAATLAGGHVSGEDRPADVPSRRSGFVRGLFSGGTLCSEASAILAEGLPEVRSNAPAGRAERLEAGEWPPGHVCIDMGEEEYTRGRPHPMIDPGPRAEAVGREGARPDTAVLLLDVVLGYSSHPDPAGVLAPAIVQARRTNPDLAVVAHVLGTEEDPQVQSRQEATLQDVGAELAATNADAVGRALEHVRS